jgi:hypothetical protein
VNMKLLKRAAEESKKNLVLVTTESGLLPLAGAVGLHVAKTPNSRPEIPMGPDAVEDDLEVDETADLLADSEDRPFKITDGNKPVGDLAGATMPIPPSRPKPDSGMETVELDNVDKAAPVAAFGAAKAGTKAAKPKKDKKLHVPDFDRFRLLLIGGGLLLVLLIVGGYFALVVMPKATISIKTNASNVNTNVDFTLNTAASSFSEGSNVVPAKQAQVQKTLTGNANATGQKNNGEKATGSITMSVCTTSPSAVNRIPTGTGVSSGNKTYITRENAEFTYNGNCGSGFRFRSGEVEIVAQSGGESFNVNNADFKVSGRSDISASGSASGGTDDIQTIVSQADIDTATAKITSGENNTAQDELEEDLESQGMFAITSTYKAGDPATTTSSKVGDASSSVTVTQVITYTMLGANEDHLKKLIDNDIESQIDTGTQSILSQGITQAGFKLKEATSNGASMNLQTVAEVGPDLSTKDIASSAAGKKSNEIRTDVESNPDVTEVTVKMSPFWVSKAPKNVDKITVTIAKPTKTANAD